MEVATSDGAAVYLHYLGKHPDYGDAVTVCPAKKAPNNEVTAELFRGGYVTFFPATAAVSQGLASVRGQLPSAGIPQRLRRPGARSANKVETWIIEDGASEVVKRELSEADRELPIAVIWNLELLLQRVSEGWRPAMEGRRD